MNVFARNISTAAFAIGLSATLQNLDGTAHAQIFVAYSNVIGEFSAYGIPVNASLISGLDQPQGMAISGTNLFVVNANRSIGEYSTSGLHINTALVTGLEGPEGLAIAGTNLFVTTYRSVGEYTISGGTNNAALISAGSTVNGLALSGTNMFVARTSSGAIASYRTAGATNNASLISGLLPGGPAGIALDGTNLYVAMPTGSINKYSISGATIGAPLISGLIDQFGNGPSGIAVSQGFLFVLLSSGNVGTYTLSGIPINSSLISLRGDGYTYFGIAIGQASTLTAAPLVTGAASSTNITISWSTNASSYLLESSPSLSATDWLVVTNIPVVSNGNYNITLSTTNSAQFFRLQTIDN